MLRQADGSAWMPRCVQAAVVSLITAIVTSSCCTLGLKSDEDCNECMGPTCGDPIPDRANASVICEDLAEFSASQFGQDLGRLNISRAALGQVWTIREDGAGFVIDTIEGLEAEAEKVGERASLVANVTGEFQLNFDVNLPELVKAEVDRSVRSERRFSAANTLRLNLDDADLEEIINRRNHRGIYVDAILQEDVAQVVFVSSVLLADSLELGFTSGGNEEEETDHTLKVNVNVGGTQVVDVTVTNSSSCSITQEATQAVMFYDAVCLDSFGTRVKIDRGCNPAPLRVR